MPDRKRPESTRTIVVGLIIRCPRDTEIESCPLPIERQLSFAEKYNWVKSLSDNDILDVFSSHCECLKNKGQDKQIR